MIDQLCFVQFLHPGQEHSFDDGLAGIKWWNQREHRRKFLIHSGRYIRDIGQSPLESGPIAFWGEWEPPSQVEMFPDSGDPELPHYHHRPLLQKPMRDANDFLQNTDPYVFGGIFRYFICRQFSVTSGRTTQLRNLQPGSVILFGSCVNRKWFGLDTVFVVRDYIDLEPQGEAHQVDDFRKQMLGNPDLVPEHYFDTSLRTYPLVKTSLRLYRGATIEDPVDGMFSFVPCMPFSSSQSTDEEEPDIPRFGRPKINIEGVVAPKMNQGYKLTSAKAIAHLPERRNTIYGLWEEVVRQVLNNPDYCLATSIDLPPAYAGVEGEQANSQHRYDQSSEAGQSGSINCSPGESIRFADDRQRWQGRTSDNINTLAEDVLGYFQNEVSDAPYSQYIVQPSIPILFFGDYDAYSNSSQKIVTVGSNPSFAEFQLNENESPRFSMIEPDDRESYLATLSAYFNEEANPYKWFKNGYEKVLKTLGASYYPHQSGSGETGNTIQQALHTDLLSPLATNPIWSELDLDCARRFAATGNDFWHRLIDILEPDRILASVAYSHLINGIRFKKRRVNSHNVEYRIDNSVRKNPYTLEKWELTLSSGKVADLIWGRKQRMPFQDLGDAQKNEIRMFYEQTICLPSTAI